MFVIFYAAVVGVAKWLTHLDAVSLSQDRKSGDPLPRARLGAQELPDKYWQARK